MVVTGASQQAFPRIAVQFEVRRPDGSFLLDATRDEFRVTEEGKDVKVLEFQAPRTREEIPTTIVLVVDHSGSMEQENRIGGLKEAVASFLEKLPEGSRVAVVGFSSEVETLCPFTTDRDRVRRAVNRLEPLGLDPVLRCRGRSARTARRADRAEGRAGPDRRPGHGQRGGQARHRDRRGPPAGPAGLHAWAWATRRRSPPPT